MTEELFKLVHEKTVKFLDEFSDEIKLKEDDFSKVVPMHIAIILASLITHVPNDENKGKVVHEIFKAILDETNKLLLSIKGTVQ